MRAFASLERILSSGFRFAGRFAVLERISMLYIFVPVFLFLLGWLKAVYALPLCAVLMVGLWFELHATASPPKNPQASDDRNRYTADFLRHVVIIAVICVLVLSSGWGIGAKRDDFLKHMAFLKDFQERPWPIGFEHTGDNNAPGMLNAYFGFYLVPGLIGKVLGWYATYFTALLWIVLGVYLAVLWFMRVLGTLSVRYALLFLFFGGLHIIGWLVVPDWTFRGDLQYIDYWHVYYTWYSAGKSFMGGFFWVSACNVWLIQEGTHHVVPGWIILLMLMYDSLVARSSRRALFLSAPAALYSSFFAIGLFPFVVASFFVTRFRKAFSFQNIVVALPLAAVVALFIISNNADFPHGPLWKWQSIYATWQLLLLFYFVVFGGYMAVCWIGDLRPHIKRLAIYTAVAIAMLLILPWYRVGYYSELTVKSAIPALMVLLLHLSSAIRGNYRVQARPNPSARLLIVLLLIGTLSAISAIMISFKQNSPQTFPISSSSVQHINELEPRNIARQLFSDGNSFFWRHLAKPHDFYFTDR